MALPVAQRKLNRSAMSPSKPPIWRRSHIQARRRAWWHASCDVAVLDSQHQPHRGSPHRSRS